MWIFKDTESSFLTVLLVHILKYIFSAIGTSDNSVISKISSEHFLQHNRIVFIAKKF